MAPGRTDVLPKEPATEFGKRNRYLEKLIPDVLENAVDTVLPDTFEKVLDRGCENVYLKYQNFKTDLQEGIGEVAGVLMKVAKYAYEKFHIGDLVFGVYCLALHHATVNAMDTVDGREVEDEAIIEILGKATDAAAAAYCPTKAELCSVAGISESDVLLFEPQTTTTRPAYAVWVDSVNCRLVWGFRGTTDLNDMLTDACASCTPYCGGYAHWGMLQAAQWFVKHELQRVRGLLDQRPGYDLLLVGHSLGAGTATMLGHLLKHDPEACQHMSGVSFQAVGVATPAVLTQELAEGCSDYITSIVLMHDLVPRFSIKNVFDLKEEMDATQWGDILVATAKDWMVPDVIEQSETYKRLSRNVSQSTKQQWSSVTQLVARGWLNLTAGVVSLLHFSGLIHPNTGISQQQQQQQQERGSAAAGAASVGDGAGASSAAAKAALTDAEVVGSAVQEVTEQFSNIAKEDVHQVCAPGRLFFLRRFDKHMGRAKYGNIEHRCVLCDSDDAIPWENANITDADETSPADAAAAVTAATPSPAAAAADAQIAAGTTSPGASAAAASGAAAAMQTKPTPIYKLILANPNERFRRIVLRETCLLDHLCNGYVEGLKFALEKAKAKKSGKC